MTLKGSVGVGEAEGKPQPPRVAPKCQRCAEV